MTVRPDTRKPDPNQAVDELIAFRDSHRLSLGPDFTLTDLIRESRISAASRDPFDCESANHHPQN